MGETAIRERDADYYKQRVDREVAEHLRVADYTTRQKFALTCRMLGMEGHGSGIITQMTAKATT